jgi:DNA helicase-2/ATP-dependent DNA helicase PcrA
LIAAAAKAAGQAVEASQLRDLATDIEWAKGREIDSADLPGDPRATDRQWTIDGAAFAAVYRAYDELKAERHQMDFEDVLLITLGMLQSRPDILDEVQTAYRWFTIDEFQDVSPLQHRLLTAWRGERDDVCAVGDVSQTIYSFTGASSSFLSDFAADFADATIVRLANCYRCSPQIVAAANGVAAHLTDQRHVVRLHSMCGDGPPPTVWMAADEVDEAATVARRISALITDGMPLAEIAVLFRMNAQSAVLEDALAEQGIPVTLRGAERFFERPEVREAITRIRGAALADDAVGPLADRVRAVLSAMNWSPQPPPTTGAVRDRWESLAALVAVAEALDAEGDAPTLRNFVTELDRRANAQHVPATAAVTLASLHSAKGLEWNAVFIVGCSEGLLPINSAVLPVAIEEERRLLYVGITRARRHLSLSWARVRQPGGTAERRPSRFLDGLSDREGARVHPTDESIGVLRSGSGARRTERQRRGPARCRACGKALVTGSERTVGRCRTCPGRDDPDLRERLSAWRLEESNRRGVPTYVVLTDATLDALVERKPATLEDLADISGMVRGKLADFGDALLALIDRQA